MTTPQFRAVVLAGERPGGGALARELGLPAGVLAPLAGQPCLARVLGALGAAARVAGGVTCGPDRAVMDAHPELGALLADRGFRWQPAADGPSASARAALVSGEPFPLLLTSGDHGLLRAATVDAFCDSAWRAGTAQGLDLVVGLVPHGRVMEAFPESRRTLLSFADGAFCGSNLFALLTPESGRALEFWSSVEADRKHPVKIARRLGAGFLLRFTTRRLTASAALEALSQRAGCRIGWVAVDDPRAAVDVDSRADWELADRLLAADARQGVSGGG